MYGLCLLRGTLTPLSDMLGVISTRVNCSFVFQTTKMSITKVHAREIFDSRGNPTVEVDLYTSKGESCLNSS